MKSNIPAYLDKSLHPLKDEVWKDIPGFDGYYQASSLGRIRSEDRVVPHARLGQQFVKGRILSHSVAKNKNIKTGDPMIDLRVSLSLNGRAYYYNTRRLIYLTFIDSSLDYEKDGQYVINRDGDGYNNAAANLQLASKSEKQKRAIERGRVIPSLITADRSTWKKQGGHSRRKPVLQYDLAGKLLAEYESIKSASRHTGIDEKSIIQVAKRMYAQWNGYVWRYKQE